MQSLKENQLSESYTICPLSTCVVTSLLLGTLLPLTSLMGIMGTLRITQKICPPLWRKMDRNTPSGRFCVIQGAGEFP